MKKSSANLLDRPIAFHRCLAELSGSVAGGLMLSQALYWSKRTSDNNGWFWKTAEDWQEETTLTRREQETARKSLREIDDGNVWFEERRGVPAKLYFRLDTDRLMEILNAQNVQSSFHKSAILDSPNPPNKSSQIRQTFLLAETTTETTAENTTERESTHPAVEVALEFFPSLAFYHQDLIVNANIQRLDLWREACTAWRDNHYSTKNIAGLIDSYYRREALENRRSQNGQNGNRRISNGEQAALDTQRIVEQLLSGDPDTLRRFGCVDPTDESASVASRLLGR